MNNENSVAALYWADLLEKDHVDVYGYDTIAAELYRLHEANQELLEALKGMCRLYPPNGKARAAIANAEGMNKGEQQT